ncbi:MAG TPA: NAD(P)-dependent oxidoreductase [Patescibacteria group bacterium]|nr:NAD(P)-dependent oxidoreductase [Patescibacteria group bacterium]
MKKLRVGFIGLGLMGNPMAKNILKRGFPLTIYNRTFSKTKELKKLGANVTKTPKELAGMSDVVITMVTGPKDVNSVLFGKDGVVEGKHEGLTVIDMETIGPSAARLISKKLAVSKVSFLDAPVTGSTPKAITGELTIFIGGKKRDYERVREVFEAMGTNLNYVGAMGSGQAVKLINNYLIAATIASLAEGMFLADAVGLPRKKVEETLRSVPAMSPMMTLKAPNFVSDTYPLLFSMSNMDKDVNLAAVELKKQLVTLPIFDRVRKFYDTAMDQGLADADFSEVIKIMGKGTK